MSGSDVHELYSQINKGMIVWTELTSAVPKTLV